MFKTVFTALSAIALVSVSGLAAPQAQSAEESPLRSEMTAFIVMKGEDGSETRTPARRVVPGGLIEYALGYENVGKAALSGLVINGQIPDNTVFVDETAEISADAAFEVLVGDMGWVDYPPVRYVENESGALVAERVAPEEFQSVRWILADSLQPGDSVDARYRTRVER